MSEHRAVVLLSGGLDSATVLAQARRDGCACYALSIAYGQRHAVEVECARRVAESLGAVEHKIVELDLSAFGGSALFPGSDIPKGEDPGRAGIPSTYVPARNTIFLSLALGWAEVVGAEAIYLGVNALDYSGYPDCRPEYVAAFAELARLATRRGVEGEPFEIRAPLLHRTKADIVRLGQQLGVDFSLTTSCYDPGTDGRPCGECDSCQLRRRGFEEAGVTDPR